VEQSTDENTFSESRPPITVRKAASLLDVELRRRDKGAFLAALMEVLRARGGISANARKAKLNRSAMYKTLATDNNPGIDTIMAILNAVGLRLSVRPSGGLRRRARRKFVNSPPDPPASGER
jgi:probable addiction module antidote protein